jgi:hypothetical protein
MLSEGSIAMIQEVIHNKTINQQKLPAILRENEAHIHTWTSLTMGAQNSLSSTISHDCYTYMLHLQTLTIHIWKWFHGFITLFSAGTTYQVQVCIHPKYQLHHVPLSIYSTVCTKTDKTSCFGFLQSSGRKWPPIKKCEVLKRSLPCVQQGNIHNNIEGFVWDEFQCPSVRKVKFIQIHLQWYIHIYSCSVHLHPVDSPRADAQKSHRYSLTPVA